jgi:hypothetical protein
MHELTAGETKFTHRKSSCSTKAAPPGALSACSNESKERAKQMVAPFKGLVSRRIPAVNLR